MAKCNNTKFEAMHRFLSEHQFEIDKNVPDKLRCGKCRNILVNPYQGSCLCKFCFDCINAMSVNGIYQCPGNKDECQEENLSQFVTNHSSNFKISKLIVKCPNELCQYKCELMKMDDHFSSCSMNNSTGSVFGIRRHDEKMADNLPRNGCNRNEILMETIGDLRKEMKQIDERNKEEMQKNKYQIKLLAENARMKDDKIAAIQNELHKNQNQLHILQMESENKICNLREEMTKVRQRRDNPNRHGTDSRAGMKKDRFQSTSTTDTEEKRQTRLMDTTCLWIVDNVLEKRGKCQNIYGEIFYHKTDRYKMQLVILNGATRDQLDIQLRVHPSDDDSRLEWPFQGNVTIQITNKAQPNASKPITKYCDIPKPNNKSSKCSALFKFSYAGLSTAGLLEDNCFIIRCKVE